MEFENDIESNSRTIQFRAICEQCNYKGDWTSIQDVAEDDCEVHAKEEDHIVHVIVKQS